MADCKGIVFLKKRYCHYELNVALFLEVYLFCCSVFDCGTSKVRGNMRRKKAFILVLSLSLVIYFEIRAKAYNLLLAFLQSLETSSLKVSLLSIKTLNNFLEELLFIFVSSNAIWILYEWRESEFQQPQLKRVES